MSVTGETARVLGLASSAIATIDRAKGIYDAAPYASGLPEIRAVAAQLPLAWNALRSAKTTFQANLNQQTTELVEPVFDLCQSNGRKLLFIFDRVFHSAEGASRAERLGNVLHTLGRNSKIEDLIHEIFESLLQLRANRTFAAAIDAPRLRAARNELGSGGDGASRSTTIHESRSIHRSTASRDESIGPQYDTIAQGSIAQRSEYSRHPQVGGLQRSMSDQAYYCGRISEYAKNNYGGDHDLMSREAIIQWELPQFVARCLGGDNDLADVFTITGTENVACGTTCLEYVMQQWGHTGTEMLEMVCLMLHSDEQYLHREINGTNVELSYRYFSCEAYFSRWETTLSDQHLSTVAVVIQMLAWMTSVFRMPQQGIPCCSELNLTQSYSTLYIKLGSLSPVSTKKCWHDIVPNTTIAPGFPNGVEEKFGLDLQWEVMLDLADVLYQTDLSKISSDQSLSKTRDGSSTTQGIFYSGVRTLLYPIKRYIDASRDQAVYEWHFDATGQSALPPEDTVLPPCNEDEFARSRHLLGFAPRNEVHLGTEYRVREYRRMSSIAGCVERSVPELSIETVGTSLGKAPVTVTLGSKIKYSQPLRGTRDPEKRTYDSILRVAERQAVILCDVGLDKKAWLVSQISVILDLVCYRIQKEGWTGLPKYAAAQPDGGAAAAEILRDSRVYNQILSRGLAGDEDLTVSRLVKEIYFAMQERQRLRDMSVRGIIRLHRKLLHSWDLLELADPPDEYSRRATAVHTTSSRVVTHYPSWLPLADNVPVYSGQNLGKVITVTGRPISLQEATRGEKYLIANVHAMKPLVQNKFDCSHCHLDGGLVVTLPWDATRHFDEKLRGVWRKRICLGSPDTHVSTITKEREHECDNRARLRDLQSDGLVMFGPEQNGLLVKLNNWADANMPAH